RHTRWPRDWSSDVCSSDLQCYFVAGDSEARLSASRRRLTAFPSSPPSLSDTASSSVARAALICAPWAFEYAWPSISASASLRTRSEERRVGKGWRARLTSV